MTKTEIIQNVIRPIESHGFDAYFVGGCVRDKLMNREPHDYDICTNATPEDLHKIFKVFSEQNSEPFGVTMPIINKELVEIATMRKDITKGRHPTIVFTKDIVEDANRRDFTVNALYEKADGTILDPTGQGIDDIKANKLRFVGDMKERLLEDPLRAFRFVRFITQKGFKPFVSIYNLKKELGDLIKDPMDFYKDVSNERKLKELIGIFGGQYLSGKVKQMFSLLHVFGIDTVTGIKDIIDDMVSCPQNPKWHSEGSTLAVEVTDKKPNEYTKEKRTDTYVRKGKSVYFLYETGHFDITIKEIIKPGNVFDHTILTMEAMAKQEYDYIDMMGAFLHDIGKPEAGRHDGINPKNGFPKMKRHPEVGAPLAYDFCKKLTMTNADCDLLQNLVLYHMDMHHLAAMTSDYGIMKILTLPYFDRLVKLARADDNGCLKLAEDDEQSLIDEALELPKIKALIGKPIPAPIVDGYFLINKGYKPNPKFRQALDVALKVQIDQGITDPEKLYSGIKSILKGQKQMI